MSRGSGADIPVCAPSGARPKPCGARVRHTGNELEKHLVEQVLLFRLRELI